MSKVFYNEQSIVDLEITAYQCYNWMGFLTYTASLEGSDLVEFASEYA